MATDTEILNKNVVDRLISEDMLLYNNNTSQKEEKLEGQELSEDYNCDCGEVFQTISALKGHESYDCTLTNETVSMTPRDPDSPITSERQESKSMSDVEGPMDINEQEEHGEYRCDECPKSFQWKSNLIRHQMSHDAGKKFSCENCDKFFTDPSNLQRHIRSQHVGARSHACSECGKTFATSSGLKQHQHIHSSVKPFQCEVCLKAYTQFSNLCRHKRMHADCRQQIKCKDCGQAFSTVTSLSKHKRFCEGALRNGMHLGFPTPDKISPLGLPHVSAMNGQSQINPALYMGMYRPPFPLYPPMTSFPLFPGTHPFSGLSPMSPLSPGKLSSACGNKPLLSPYSLSAIGKIERENKTDDHKRRRNSVGSESNDSPVSSGTEHDNNSSASDAESDCSSSKKSRFDPDESRDIRYVPFQPHRPIPYMPLPQNNKISASSSPVSPVNRTTDSLSSPNNRLTESSMPYDFSKTNKTRISSPVRERSPEIQTKSSGEQPLDLTRKTQKEEIVAPENSRKTHIFGLPCPISETKLHYAYPQPPKPMMLDHLHMEKAKLQQSLQEVTKFLPFSRFPLGNTSYAAAALGMLKADDKAFSPLMKIDNLQEHFQFGSPHKMKERYSCKFCGKVFPRSANLTRHLRTHTGEQPYKCKYCERSFSISSNLQRHVRNIHNKEKPFRCSLCDRCFGQQTNLDRHLKKHETEGPNVRDSPVTEPDLDSKDEAYFSEIRNFIGKATDIDITSENPSDIISNGLHHMIDRNADRDEKFDDAVDDVEEESDEENDVDDEDEHLDSKDNRVVSNHQNHDKPLNNNDIKPSVMIKEDSDKIALNKLVRPEVILENAFRKYLPCM